MTNRNSDLYGAEQFAMISCRECLEEGTLYPINFGLFWTGFILSCTKHGEILSMDLHSKEAIDDFFHKNTPLRCECHNIEGEEIYGIIQI